MCAEENGLIREAAPTNQQPVRAHAGLRINGQNELGGGASQREYFFSLNKGLHSLGDQQHRAFNHSDKKKKKKKAETSFSSSRGPVVSDYTWGTSEQRKQASRLSSRRQILTQVFTWVASPSRKTSPLIGCVNTSASLSSSSS